MAPIGTTLVSNSSKANSQDTASINDNTEMDNILCIRKTIYPSWSMSLTKISSYWNGVYRYNAKIPSLLFSGSLFRSGSRFSYFGSQVQIWADIYTGSVNINNLEGYEMEHRFVINAAKHPHEGELENNRSSI